MAKKISKKAVKKKTVIKKKAVGNQKASGRAVKKIVKKVVKKVLAKSQPEKSVSEVKTGPFQTVRGMRDLLPSDQPYWDQVRKISEKLSRDFSFSRIDVPLLEFSDLFVRGIGEGTDIIDKEIYAFTTRGGDKVALRPEMTAGICRAYIQNGMGVLPKPVKLFSIGPVYRYDRPQEGRYREHYQVNFDAFGESDPIIDAQMIQIAARLIQSLGIKNIQIQVNSIGCPGCRKDYKNLLVNYLESKKNKLCQDCKKRLAKNPLRVLDCKEDKCFQVSSGAPQSIDHLCDECRVHFKTLLEYLDELDLPYSINPKLVRGLDYYTKTVFEIISGEDGAKKNSLGGGGRYDGLVKMLGGESAPAAGFGLGIDRLVIEMKRIQAKPYQPPKAKVFLAQLGELAKKKSLKMFLDLEKNGVPIAESFGRGSLKAQLRVANKLEVELTLILGQKEAIDGTVIIKNMASGEQETVRAEKIVEAVKKKLKSDNVITYHNN